MKKEDFLKLGVSEELAVKCESAFAEEIKGYIPKARFNEVNEENKSLKADVSERDRQLEDLKKSSGDNAELKKQIETLQTANKEQQKAHEAEMNQLRLENAVDSALAAAGAKNGKTVKALLQLDKVKLGEDGKLSGLDEQLSEIRKSDGYLFAEAQPAHSFKGFQPGASGDNIPGGKPDPSNMTYSETLAYLAANPGASIN